MSQFIEMFGCLAERVALSSLCDTFIDGDWIEAKDQSGSGIRLIQTGNVGVGTFKDKGDRARYISEETFNRLNCTEVVEGDILISRLPEPVGRACIIPAGLGKSITAVDCTIIRLNDKVLSKFFVTFTNTPYYAMQIKKVLSGTTRLRVSRANLGKIQVPLPAIDKQQQFVTIAEQADKSGFDGFKSQFIEMFGDFHNKVQIKDVCLVVSGKSIPTKLEDIDGNNPYIKVADFNIPGNEKYITIAQRYVSDDSASYSKQIPEGSVIFAKNGAASMSNKKRLTKIRCCIDMNTMAVFPKNESILSDFLFATIEAMDVSSHVRQGAIPSISPKSIEDSYIAMPTMEEQYRYVSIAKHADKSGSVLQHMIAC